MRDPVWAVQLLEAALLGRVVLPELVEPSQVRKLIPPPTQNAVDVYRQL